MCKSRSAPNEAHAGATSALLSALCAVSARAVPRRARPELRARRAARRGGNVCRAERGRVADRTRTLVLALASHSCACQSASLPLSSLAAADCARTPSHVSCLVRLELLTPQSTLMYESTCTNTHCSVDSGLGELLRPLREMLDALCVRSDRVESEEATSGLGPASAYCMRPCILILLLRPCTGTGTGAGTGIRTALPAWH